MTEPAGQRHYGGHSTEERRLARRERLIEAATRVYGEVGYRNATVKAVCEDELAARDQSIPHARYRLRPVASRKPSSPTRSWAARDVIFNSLAIMPADTMLLAISQLPARLHCLRGLPPTPPPTSSQPPTRRFPQRQHFPAATLIRTRQHQAHPQLEHAPESPVSKTTQPRSQEKFGPSSDSSTRLMTSPILTLPTRGRASVHRMRRRRRSLHNHYG